MEVLTKQSEKMKDHGTQPYSLTRASGNKAAFSIGPVAAGILAISDSTGYRQPTPGRSPTDITGVAAYIVTRCRRYSYQIRQERWAIFSLTGSCPDALRQQHAENHCLA